MKRVLFSLIAIVFCGACQRGGSDVPAHAFVVPNLLAQSEMPRDLLKINSLAVLPAQISPQVQYPEGWESTVTQELNQAAREQLDLSLIAESDVQSAFKSAPVRQPLSPEEATKLGKRLGADGLLSTTILHYVKRVGSAVGATTPAGVDFSMSLIRASDGKEVWAASYHFQDEALSENLFKVKERMNDGQGPGWRRADDLMAGGFRSALSDLSTKRLAQFSGH
ncbi:MAG: hypothetical protein J0M12_07650 [Deltaproteobacteria bacterium]|nr:hypothetical protein [Deltaproteobacteria bacterium]